MIPLFVMAIGKYCVKNNHFYGGRIEYYKKDINGSIYLMLRLIMYISSQGNIKIQS